MPVNMKAMIGDTFFQLAQKKSIDKITVKDLVETCGISRQSFYYHFQDILEVIEWLAEQAMQKALERSLRAETPQDAIRDLVSSFVENHENIERLLRSQRREQIEAILSQAFSAYLREIALKRSPTVRMPAGNPELALSFFSYGIVGFLREALRSGTRDVDALSHQLCTIITASLDGLQRWPG